MNRIVVIGLGPAGPELVSRAATDAIEAHPPAARWARTDRHPSIGVLGDHRSFDGVYQAAEQVAEVYPQIVARLAELASTHGSVCYAVPGSPLVAEHTVELLRGLADIELVVHAALSFLDLAWLRLGVDPFAAGARLVDGHGFAVEAAGERGPLLVGQCDSRDVLSDIKLAVEHPPSAPVTVLQRLGLPDEAVFEVAWEDLDRSFTPDHLTSLWIPELAAPVAAEVVRFEELVRTLRERCPWDSVQTHQSLRPFLVEEAYEVLDAIEQLDVEVDGNGSGDGVDELEEELGDLLFQVVIHATIAAEQGWFTLADVARGIHDKLRRRHPHVFADVVVDGAEDVVRNWDEIKAAEKGRQGPFDGIPETFPARLFAEKVLRRAARAGLPAELGAELAELDRAEAAVRAAAARIIAGG